MSIWAVKRWLNISVPSAVRKIPLGALLIPRITIRSIHAAVVNSVFGFSRLQKGNTEGIVSASKINPAFIYVRKQANKSQINRERRFTTTEESSRSLVMPLISKHACRPSPDPYWIATAQIFQKKELNKRWLFPLQGRRMSRPLNCGSRVLILKGDDTNMQTKIKHAKKNRSLFEINNACTEKKEKQATNNKFHMDDKIPESSVWRWREMGLDAFLQGGTENTLV